MHLKSAKAVRKMLPGLRLSKRRDVLRSLALRLIRPMRLPGRLSDHDDGETNRGNGFRAEWKIRLPALMMSRRAQFMRGI